MSISITEAKRTEKKEVTRIVCPDCGEKVRGIGLLKGSRIDGLLFKCKKCKAYKEIKTE